MKTNIEGAIKAYRESGRKCRFADQQTAKFMSPIQIITYNLEGDILKHEFELEPQTLSLTAEQIREAYKKSRGGSNEMFLLDLIHNLGFVEDDRAIYPTERSDLFKGKE